jgi:hypothetical protein
LVDSDLLPLYSGLLLHLIFPFNNFAEFLLELLLALAEQPLDHLAGDHLMQQLIKFSVHVLNDWTVLVYRDQLAEIVDEDFLVAEGVARTCQ